MYKKKNNKIRNKKTLWVVMLIIGILFGIILALLLATEQEYIDLKDNLIIIFINFIIYYLISFSLNKIESKNNKIWIAFILINILGMLFTKHDGGFNFVKFINGITFGVFPMILSYYLCGKLIFKKKNRLIKKNILIFSSIIILLNLFLPTHINKFLAINIFKNENFESQKFYCNVIDNYNIQYKKNIPYTYNLTNKQLNNLRVIRIYSKYKAPYEYTGLSLNDINSKDLSKIKYAYNKDKNKPDCESNCSTGIINYNFYGYSEKEFKIDTQNVDFTIYYNFYNSEFDTLAINYSNSQYTSLNIYSTQFKKLKMNDNYLDISKLGIKDYPYIVTERIPNEIIISGDRRVFDIESEGWKVIVTDKDGNVKSNDDILEKYDVIKVGKIFKWIVYIHNN